jgi:pyridoxal 5'-phosphate synthase pdxT subunit
VAVLALQGDFQKHIDRLAEIGADSYAARLPEEIASADALIIPGGESTTMGKLLQRYRLVEPIVSAQSAGKPIYGTCAGMIVLANHIADGTSERGGQNTLQLLDITVSRNAFGRQIDSFECELDAPAVIVNGEPPLKAVFIRAPIVVETGPSVQTLATYDGQIVFVRQSNLLASSFHPELTDDDRVHRYFLAMIDEQSSSGSGRTAL